MICTINIDRRAENGNSICMCWWERENKKKWENYLYEHRTHRQPCVYESARGRPISLLFTIVTPNPSRNFFTPTAADYYVCSQFQANWFCVLSNCKSNQSFSVNRSFSASWFVFHYDCYLYTFRMKSVKFTPFGRLFLCSRSTRHWSIMCFNFIHINQLTLFFFFTIFKKRTFHKRRATFFTMRELIHL